MAYHTKLRTAPALGIALLLCCVVVGCAGMGQWRLPGLGALLPCPHQPRVCQVIPCDPCYGFHPTRWHAWPEFCTSPPPLRTPEGIVAEGAAKAGNGAPAAGCPADWEVVPKPQEEPDAANLPPLPEEEPDAANLPPLPKEEPDAADLPPLPKEEPDAANLPPLPKEEPDAANLPPLPKEEPDAANLPPLPKEEPDAANLPPLPKEEPQVVNLPPPPEEEPDAG